MLIKYAIIMNGLQLVESCWPVAQTHETSIKLKYLLEFYFLFDDKL